MLDAAAYIGVGFDGRGGYNAQSRKISLVTRACDGRNTFAGGEVPDTMNAFGIYNVDAETQSFTSADGYVDYLTKKSQTANQKGMFQQEKDSMEQKSSFGGDLGVIGAGIGGAVG